MTQNIASLELTIAPCQALDYSLLKTSSHAPNPPRGGHARRGIRRVARGPQAPRRAQRVGAWPRVDVERVKRLRRAEAKGAGLVTSFRNAHAPQVMIHGSKPISATIGNYDAVYRVLKGTPHEWMLERHLEPKSSR